jgi:hypothetical protein
VIIMTDGDREARQARAEWELGYLLRGQAERKAIEDLSRDIGVLDREVTAEWRDPGAALQVIDRITEALTSLRTEVEVDIAAAAKAPPAVPAKPTEPTARLADSPGLLLLLEHHGITGAAEADQ